MKENDYIVSYILDTTKETEEALNYITEKTGKRHINMRGKGTLSVEDWLYLIKNSKFVVTDSFHGACFAIIFNKPFICFGNQDRGFSRFESLFNTFSLPERCVLSPLDVQNKDLLSHEIDYIQINSLIDKIKSQAIEKIKNIMNAPKDTNKHISAAVEIEYLKAKVSCLNKYISMTKERSKLAKKIKKYGLLKRITFGKLHKKIKAKQNALKNIYQADEQLLKIIK